MMKMKSFLLRFSTIILVAVSLMFGAVSVGAVYEETLMADNNSSYSVAVTDYDDGYYDDYYDGGYDDEHYDSQPPVRTVNWFRIIRISLLISIVVTVMAVWMIYRGYKHNGKTEPYPYENKAPLELTDTEDILVDTDIRRERRERERR